MNMMIVPNVELVMLRECCLIVTGRQMKLDFLSLGDGFLEKKT